MRRAAADLAHRLRILAHEVEDLVDSTEDAEALQAQLDDLKEEVQQLERDRKGASNFAAAVRDIVGNPTLSEHQALEWLQAQAHRRTA